MKKTAVIVIVVLLLTIAFIVTRNDTKPTSDGFLTPIASPVVTPEVSTVTSTSPFVSQISIFLIALEDNGKSGEKIGCGDSAVPVKRSIPKTQAPLTASISELIGMKDRYFGESGLYNALYSSALTLEKASITSGKAEIRLTGTLSLGGICDAPRVKAQLEKTALQFPSIRTVSLFINDLPIDEVLSQR